MKRRSLLVLGLILGTTFPRAATPTIAIDASSAAGKVSPLLYGLMTEEINHSYDGGLYAELVQNRAFLDDAASPVHWAPVHGDGATATVPMEPVGWSSKMGVHVRPASVVFQTPPLLTPM